MKSLLRLKPYIRPYLWMIVTSALLAIPLSALRAAPALLVKTFVDKLLVQKDLYELWPTVLKILAIGIANFIIRFPHYYLLRLVIIKVNQRLKNELFDHLLGLSADYFTTQSTGTLISRVGVDTQNIDAGISAINIIVREPITFVMLLGYCLHTNWRLTIIIFFIFPPLAWVFTASGKHLKRYIHKMNEENARLFSTLQESFTGIRVIKAFRLEHYVRGKFQERNQSFADTHEKTARLEESSHPTVELLTFFVIAAVVGYGAWQVIQGRMTPGELMAFFLAFGLMLNPVRQMNDVNIKLNQAGASCERVFQIFDWKSNLRETPHPIALKSFEREIQVENVSFAYPDSPSRDVLKNVSFTIPKGGVVALVGASGAGKSSMVSLLPRIFDVTQGQIKVDGHDIREYALSDLQATNRRSEPRCFSLQRYHRRKYSLWKTQFHTR
ncbi:unnamed protein product [Sphagnum jensenii]|uniref:ABC transmembrane type-1 domain-containing protein n=1 Tax=Sphagnum jensenii TaxID=128206 RepID=A0ABP0V8A3_9BRYO